MPMPCQFGPGQWHAVAVQRQPPGPRPLVRQHGRIFIRTAMISVSAMVKGLGIRLSEQVLCGYILNARARRARPAVGNGATETNGAASPRQALPCPSQALRASAAGSCGARGPHIPSVFGRTSRRPLLPFLLGDLPADLPRPAPPATDQRHACLLSLRAASGTPCLALTRGGGLSHGQLRPSLPPFAVVWPAAATLPRKNNNKNTVCKKSLYYLFFF